MSSSPLPQSHSLTKLSRERISGRRNGFSRSFKSIPGSGTFFGALLFACLILYMAFVSPPGRPLLYINSTGHVTTPTNHGSSSPAYEGAPLSPSDTLSLEQIRDIVAPTRGFLARDYTLNLGWNNVSIHGSRFEPN